MHGLPAGILRAPWALRTGILQLHMHAPACASDRQVHSLGCVLLPVRCLIPAPCHACRIKNAKLWLSNSSSGWASGYMCSDNVTSTGPGVAVSVSCAGNTFLAEYVTVSRQPVAGSVYLGIAELQVMRPGSCPSPSLGCPT